MWKRIIVLTAVFVFALSPGLMVHAEDTQDIEAQIRAIDQSANSSAAGHQFTENLKTRYNVDDATIQELREKNMGFGEIATTLSFAQEMRGGINDQNIQKIIDLRRSQKKGWGEIAKDLKVNVDEVTTNIQSIHSGADINASGATDLRNRGSLNSSDNTPSPGPGVGTGTNGVSGSNAATGSNTSGASSGSTSSGSGTTGTPAR